MGRQQDDRMTFSWWTLATMISSGCQHQTREGKILFGNQIQIYFWQKIKHFALSTFKIIFIFLNTLLTVKFEKISG